MDSLISELESQLVSAFLIQIKATNKVVAGTKGQNKCVCLNTPRLQFQSPPSENWNNGEGGKLKKRGLFQINKRVDCE